VASQRVVPDEDAQLDAVLDPSFDGRRTVVTGAQLTGLSDGGTTEPAGRARIVEYEPEKVVVDATATRPAELVLTDVHFPGWKVEIDGKSADLHRVDYLLRGTTLPAGRHRVEFSYAPASFRAGWIVSLLALVALLGTALVARRRGRG
jgi:Bacterial membrane protein YfhO